MLTDIIFVPPHSLFEMCLFFMSKNKYSIMNLVIKNSVRLDFFTPYVIYRVIAFKCRNALQKNKANAISPIGISSAQLVFNTSGVVFQGHFCLRNIFIMLFLAKTFKNF